MDEQPSTSLFAKPSQPGTQEETIQTEAATAPAEQPMFGRGSGRISEVPPIPPVPSTPRDRMEHSIMEGLPEAKAERIAAMRRELADLQRQLIESQQRIATELQGRVEDAERFEALEARLHAQEIKTKEDAARAAELEIQAMGLRTQVTSATAIADALHNEIAARDAQLVEVRQQQTDVAGQIETQSALLRDANTLLETRNAEITTLTTERDTAQATITRLESELEDQRKLHREVTEQLEHQFASLRDAKATIETRDAALAKITSERDARIVELDEARRDLDTTRGKASEIAKQLVRFGQELSEGISTNISLAQPEPINEAKPVVEARVERPAPPPLPQPRVTAPQIETILEVTEEPKATSRIGSGLLTLGGVLVGCVVTYALMNGSSAASVVHEDQAAARPSAAIAPLAIEPAPSIQPAAIPEPALTVEPARASIPTPVANPAASTENAPVPAASAEIATKGVLVLSPSAARHRLFVDGKVVDVARSRAVVPCGTHEIKIGSRGTPQTLEVACGVETTIE